MSGPADRLADILEDIHQSDRTNAHRVLLSRAVQAVQAWESDLARMPSRDVATSYGVSLMTVSRWKRGQHSYTLRRLLERL